jgi:hypothetical protein
MVTQKKYFRVELRIQKKTLVIASIILLMINLGSISNQVVGKTLEFKIRTKIEFKSANDWNNIDLLYPNQYHTPEQLTEELLQISNAAPEIVDLFSLGKSIEGRDIHCIRITNEQNTLPKAGVLFVAQHHAREQITVEVILRFMLILVNTYGINPEITEYLQTEELFFIPTLNPDGLHYTLGNDSMQGDSWLRRNLHNFDDDRDGLLNEDPPDDENGDGVISEFSVIQKSTGNVVDYYLEGIDNDGDGKINEDPIGGVDLNRNYAYRWNDSSCNSGVGSDSTLPDYPGTSAFSEPETRAFRDFVKKNDRWFATAISLHSGINATYFPWASKAYWAETTLYSRISTDLVQILPENFITESELSELSESVGYTCAGEWGDWMYDKRNCLVPLTFEIYHNLSSDDEGKRVSFNNTHEIWRWDGIYGYFSPDESAIDAVWDDIKSVFLYWLRLTPRIKPTIKSVTGGKNASDTLKVKLSIVNLSPFIGTINELRVTNETCDSVTRRGSPVTISEIPAGEGAVEKIFEFELKQDFSIGTNLTLYIGNEFVGYTPITIEEKQIEETQPVTIGIIAPILALTVIVVLRFMKLSRKD